MIERQGCLHETRFLKLSMTQTLQEVSLRFLLQRHQRLFPSFVEHLQVLVAHLNVQQVVQAVSSPLHIFVVADGVDLLCDLSSCQHQSPCFSCDSSATGTFLLNSAFMIFKKPSCNLGIQHVAIFIRAPPNTNPASCKSCVEVAWTISGNQPGDLSRMSRAW